MLETSGSNVPQTAEDLDPEIMIIPEINLLNNFRGKETPGNQVLSPIVTSNILMMSHEYRSHSPTEKRNR
jgi:hypothetical protein